MIRCLIIDDEPNAHLVLKHYIDLDPYLEMTAQCYTVSDAARIMRNQHVDLIFLDIDLPDASGLSLLKGGKYQTHTIITTAYESYAVESYEYNVLDYLLKPFSHERFIKAIDRYKNTNPKVDPSVKVLDFKIDDEIISFEIENLVYIQSWGNYIKLFTREDNYICAMTTTKAEQYLPKEQFVRVHKSYIVNVDYIASLNTDYVVLKTNSYLPVGITYRKFILSTINR